MGAGVSLIPIAVGAVLAWAVTVNTEGVNLNTVGVILLIVGAVGLVFSLAFWGSWGGHGPLTSLRPRSGEQCDGRCHLN